MQRTKRSKDALDTYKQALDEVKKSIDGITNGMKKATDEAKKGQKAAAAIQSLQLSGAVDNSEQPEILLLLEEKSQKKPYSKQRNRKKLSKP